MRDWEHTTETIFESDSMMVFKQIHSFNPHFPKNPEHRVTTCEYIISNGSCRVLIGEDNANELMKVLMEEFNDEAEEEELA
ncbi:hypothetical protein [Anaerovibrio sp. RM50]|uniref:hypothetical protein n=1 Tax=Anaerovibrio sp. RM50 TaxID=1200557 RepID=UPI0004859AC2|nr:hypothetical protein [Anaerovibrio sp. RM50]